MDTYDPQAIEAKWQRVWEDARAFYVDEPGARRTQPTRKFYMLEMLPYPSGTLHMGHVLNYTLGDVLTHFQPPERHATVLRPMGFDSFGLPAENAAIREGGHPREITERNIEHIARQMQPARLGDRLGPRDRRARARRTTAGRSGCSCSFFEAGLAYRKAAPVNWCPNDQTVLANEQVIDGRCERCGAEVEARNLEQWFFRSPRTPTSCCDDHELIDWPERTKTIQRNWIGRSEGAELLFRVDELDVDVPVFTTRAGHGLRRDVLRARARAPARRRSSPSARRAARSCASTSRTAGAKRGEERAAAEEKTGVFTGRYATNPATGEQIPIWVADYVLMEYGTGAIMAVPGARRARLRVRASASSCRSSSRRSMRRGATCAARRARQLGAVHAACRPPRRERAIVEWLGERGRGRPAVSYRLRDWGFSRQRYWGCPIPIVYCERLRRSSRCPTTSCRCCCPEVEDYRPKGKPPLASQRGVAARAVPALRRAGPARGRHDGHLRRLVLVLPALLRPAQRPGAVRRGGSSTTGCPVDQYIGGIDHATGHLLYSRFFVKVLNDLGLRRLPRAVRAPVPPGLGAARRHEDVEVEAAT